MGVERMPKAPATVVAANEANHIDTSQVGSNNFLADRQRKTSAAVNRIRQQVGGLK